MPLKSGDLTRKEIAFINAYTESGDRVKAERAAGYSKDGGLQVLRRPEIQQQITQVQLARISSDVLPLAVSVHLEVLRNAKAPAAARIQAVKLAYDYGFPDQATDRKDMVDMSPDELARVILTAETALVELAKDVTPTSDPDVFG